MSTPSLCTLITGASSGIGEALARQLAAEGQTLVLVARRQDRLEALAAELRGPSLRVEVLAADLEQAGAAPALLARVAELGLSVDTLINNAGFGLNAPVVEHDPARLQAMLTLNMLTLTELCHGVLPAMLVRRQGRILNIASVAAFQPCPRFAAYGASKAYVLSFSEALAAEVRGQGVTVTAVCPGATRTEFHDVSNNTGVFATKVMDSAEDVARQGLRALGQRRPAVVTGLLNKPLPLLVRLSPRRLVVWLAGALVTPRGGQA